MRPLFAGLSLMVGAVSGAQAAPTPGRDLETDAFEIIVPTAPREWVSARQLIPESPESLPSTRSAATDEEIPSLLLARSRTLYLNRNGVTIKPALINDSRSDSSTIARQISAIPRWSVDQATWDATVSCMREIFAPFAIELVTSDPGDTPHIEAVFGGSPGLLGLPANIIGISPFTSSCSTIENSVVYTFTELLTNPRSVCEVMAQEVAHSYGLDHELLAADPMTYLPFTGKRAFQNRLAPCGETTARPCGISGSTCRAQQNSVQLLLERLGPADPESPTSTFVTPSQNEIVGSGFSIDVTAKDNIGVASVEFLLDGVSIGNRTAAPYSITAQGISSGPHILSAVVSDHARNFSQNNIWITVDPEIDEHGLLSGCAVGSDDPTGTVVLILAGCGAIAAGGRRRRKCT